MKFTQIPANTFETMQMNAGIFVKSFNPSTNTYSGLMGATTGGGQFSATPEYYDYGEDIDNCPKNTMELKKQDNVDCKLTATFVTISPETALTMMGAGDVDGGDTTHLIPRRDLKASDFEDVWWIGDYSQYNEGSGAGFCAIHLMNALSTGGFQVQSTDNGKGQFAMELTGHYSIEHTDIVPYEVYIKAGTDSGQTPEILLEQHSITIKVGDDYTLNVVRKIPGNATITWNSSATGKATVSSGVVHGAATGTTIITASITDNGVTYSDTCTVIVEAAS